MKNADEDHLTCYLFCDLAVEAMFMFEMVDFKDQRQNEKLSRCNNPFVLGFIIYFNLGFIYGMIFFQPPALSSLFHYATFSLY